MPLFIIFVFGIQCCLVCEQFGIQLLEKEQNLRDHVAATPSQRWHDCRSHNNFSFKMYFLLYFLIPWGFYRVCISTATGLSLYQEWQALALPSYTHKHTVTTVWSVKKQRGVFFTFTFPVLLEHIVGLL